MPELPEVETVVRNLAPQIVGSVLQGWEVFDSLLKFPNRSKLLSGRSVSSVERLGKQIILKFDDPASCHVAVHLRMSGRLFWSSGKPSTLKKDFVDYQRQFSVKRDAHLRIRFLFDNGSLLFVDPRRFGTVVLSDQINDFVPKGAEPTARSFTVTLLKTLLGSKSSQPIKTWLLRQDKIVGIGNIYASEILFTSGIDPYREVGSLNDEEIIVLHKAIKDILRKAIKNCGTTFSDFQSTLGETGKFQRYLKVYQREGEQCLVCGSMIEKSNQAGRSSFYCSGCQH